MLFGLCFALMALVYFLFFRSRWGDSFMDWSWRYSPWRFLRSKEKRDRAPFFSTARFYVWTTIVMMSLRALIFPVERRSAAPNQSASTRDLDRRFIGCLNCFTNR